MENLLDVEHTNLSLLSIEHKAKHENTRVANTKYTNQNTEYTNQNIDFTKSNTKDNDPNTKYTIPITKCLDINQMFRYKLEV